MSDTYFTLLGLSQAFALDASQLEQHYLTLQRQHHPDKFVGKGQMERGTAAAISARINDAYQTLKDPLTRARYVLALENIEVGGEKDTLKPSMELLEEMMELRERQEEADTDEKRHVLNADIHADIDRTFAKLATLFELGDKHNAAELVIRLGYLYKAIKPSS